MQATLEHTSLWGLVEAASPLAQAEIGSRPCPRSRLTTALPSRGALPGNHHASHTRTYQPLGAGRSRQPARPGRSRKSPVSSISTDHRAPLKGSPTGKPPCKPHSNIPASGGWSKPPARSPRPISEVARVLDLD